MTHLPIVGSLLGTLVLLYGLWAKSNETKMAAYYLLVISSAGAVISYLTGEGAEESVEKIQGVTKQAIDQHEDFALIGLVALIVLGCIAFLGLFLTFKKNAFINRVAYLTLFTGLISFGIMAWTGYLGGQIRHSEISAAATQLPASNEKEDDD
jgi:uncharacterized membrane protein